MKSKLLFPDDKFKILRKPFLRWIGGKIWISDIIKTITSEINFMNYHEPFLGGGSVFFKIHKKNKAYLSDVNSDLINTYSCVKKNPEKIISYLSNFKQDEKNYYNLRKTIFKDKFQEASRFIFLNKTSFNGLYRVNLKGEYNASYGKKKYDINNLSVLIKSASHQLKNTELRVIDFKESIKAVKKNDLVFLDPPYTKSFTKESYVKYDMRRFSMMDQNDLLKLMNHINDKGAYYVMSNSDHPKIKDVFKNDTNSFITCNRTSVVASKKASRNNYSELLFKNF